MEQAQVGPSQGCLFGLKSLKGDGWRDESEEVYQEVSNDGQHLLQKAKMLQKQMIQ